MRRTYSPTMPLGAPHGPPRPPPVYWRRGDLIWWQSPRGGERLPGVVVQRSIVLGHHVLTLAVSGRDNFTVRADSLRITGRA